MITSDALVVVLCIVRRAEQSRESRGCHLRTGCILTPSSGSATPTRFHEWNFRFSILCVHSCNTLEVICVAYTLRGQTGDPQGASGTAETQAPTELSMLACVSSSVFCSCYHYTTTEGTFKTILVKNRLGYQDLDLHQPETGHF